VSDQPKPYWTPPGIDPARRCPDPEAAAAGVNAFFRRFPSVARQVSGVWSDANYGSGACSYRIDGQWFGGGSIITRVEAEPGDRVVADLTADGYVAAIRREMS
jgi:hypothetical protein